MYVTIGQTQNSALTFLVGLKFREDWDGNPWTGIRTSGLSVSQCYPFVPRRM